MLLKNTLLCFMFVGLAFGENVNTLIKYKENEKITKVDDGDLFTSVVTYEDHYGHRVYVYNKNDILLSEGESVGEYHKFGIWKEYHPVKGYLLEKGEYSFGFRIGIWETYKKNGKLKKLIDYSK